MFRKFLKYELSNGWSSLIVLLMVQSLLGYFISLIDMREVNILLSQIYNFTIVIGVWIIRRPFSKHLFEESGYLIFSVPISSLKLVLSKWLSIFIKLLTYCIFLGGIIYIFLIDLYYRASFIGSMQTQIPDFEPYMVSIIVPLITFIFGNIFVYVYLNFSIVFNVLYKGPLRIVVVFFSALIIFAAIVAYIIGALYIPREYSSLLDPFIDYYYVLVFLLPAIFIAFLPIYLLNNKLELS